MRQTTIHRLAMGGRLGVCALACIVAAARAAAMAADAPREPSPQDAPGVPQGISGVFALQYPPWDPEGVLEDVARIYGILVIIVRDLEADLPRLEEPVYAHNMEPDRFVRMLSEAAPGREARRHPHLPVWLLFPRNMEWRWFLEERVHAELGPGTAEDRLAVVMAGMERARRMEFVPEGGEEQGRFRDPGPIIPRLVAPRKDPEGISASEGPVWHRLAEILHREPRSFLLLTHRRSERYDTTRPEPDEDGEQVFCHWAVSSSRDYFALTAPELAGIFADPHFGRRSHGMLYEQMERMPIAHLSDVEQELHRLEADPIYLVYPAWRPLLSMSDWAVHQAVSRGMVDPRTAFFAQKILMANSANPDVRAYFRRVAPRAGEGFAERIRTQADEQLFRDLEPLLAAAEERSARWFAMEQAWAAAGRQGTLPGSWQEMDIPPAIQADGNRRFEAIAARIRERNRARSEEHRKSREAAARHRALLAEMLDIDLMRPLAHILPNLDPEPAPPAEP